VTVTHSIITLPVETFGAVSTTTTDHSVYIHQLANSTSSAAAAAATFSAADDDDDETMFTTTRVKGW